MFSPDKSTVVSTFAFLSYLQLYWVAPMFANFVVATFYRLVFPEPRPQPIE